MLYTNRGMESKRRKTLKTNKEQIRLIVERMAKYPTMATGRAYGHARQVYDDIWEQLGEELNSLGPPFRNRPDWQRVWTCYKINFRRRNYQNRLHFQATADEASLEEPPTHLKRTIIDILDTKPVVSPAAQGIGVNLKKSFPTKENLSRTPSSPPLFPPPNKSSIRISKRTKLKALEEQIKDQLLTIKKLEGIMECCSNKTYKEIIEIKKQKLLLLKNKEEEEASLRKLNIELKQKKLLSVDKGNTKNI